MDIGSLLSQQVCCHCRLGDYDRRDVCELIGQGMPRKYRYRKSLFELTALFI